MSFLDSIITKKIDGWISYGYNLSISSQKFPFGFKAVVKNNILFFERGVNYG